MIAAREYLADNIGRRNEPARTKRRCTRETEKPPAPGCPARMLDRRGLSRLYTATQPNSQAPFAYRAEAASAVVAGADTN
jgi:hypothetical protein